MASYSFVWDKTAYETVKVVVQRESGWWFSMCLAVTLPTSPMENDNGFRLRSHTEGVQDYTSNQFKCSYRTNLLAKWSVRGD